MLSYLKPILLLHCFLHPILAGTNRYGYGSFIIDLSEKPHTATTKNIDVSVIDDDYIKNIENIASIDVLGLVGEDLETIEPGAFKSTPHMFNLTITGSKKLTEIKSKVFEGLTKLKILDLHNNAINKIAPDAFKGLTNLQELYLNHNQLSELNPEWFALKLLNTINLEYNQFTTLPANAFEKLENKKIMLISFEHNKFQEIPDDAFQGLEEIDVLNFSYNEIRTVTGKFIRGINVTSLDLIWNKIECIAEEDFEKFSTLHHLGIYGNPFSYNCYKFFKEWREIHGKNTLVDSVESQEE